MNRIGIAAKGALAAGVLVASFTLSGCAPNPIDAINEEIAKGGAEELIEGMTGGGIDLDLKGGELPDDFPADVPVPDGTIAMSQKMKTDEGTMWMVQYDVSDGKAAAEQAREMLLSEGWEEAFWTDNMGMVGGMFTSGEYGINLTGIDDGEDSAFSYSVIHGAND